MENLDKYPKELQHALLEIEKNFGLGSIFRLGDNSSVDIERMPLGVLGIDRALGGGLPKGRVIEIYGPESSGKTTICLEAIAEAQRQNEVCAFIDVEHALDPGYAKALGVDLNKLLVSQPDSGEEALNILDTLCKGGVGLAVVDSVAALVTKQELQGDIGDAVVGAQARLMSSALRKLTPTINSSKVICIFTNQIREKIGVMFGNPETTPGGKALKFYSSIRLDIRRTGALKASDGTVFGNKTKIKVVKNKVAPPFTECEFEIHYGKGISRGASLLEEALSQGIMSKRGSWIEYKGSTIGQGTSATIKLLEEDKELFHQIYKELKGEQASAEIKINAPIAETLVKVTPITQSVNPTAVNSEPPVIASSPLEISPNNEDATEDDDMPPDVDEDPTNISAESTPAEAEIGAAVESATTVSVRDAINQTLTEVERLSPSHIAETIHPLFPQRDIKALKNQVAVTLSNGVKKGSYINPAPGEYSLTK